VTRLLDGMRDTNTRRAAIVIGLLVVVFGVRFVLDDPTYLGATFLLVLPTVLAALVEHLRVALAAYAPAGGDDVCLLAARNRARVGSDADR
jgi:hypothetical protein